MLNRLQTIDPIGGSSNGRTDAPIYKSKQFSSLSESTALVDSIAYGWEC